MTQQPFNPTICKAILLGWAGIVVALMTLAATGVFS